MRAMLNIDGDLLRRAQAAAGTESKTHVVELALRVLIEQAARHRLAALYGSVPKASAPPRRRLRKTGS